MGEPEEHNRNELIHRIGTFFLMIGIGMLIFFLLSEAAGKTTFQYFCWSTLLVTLGLIFRAQLKRSVSSSGRFGIFKRLRKGKDE
jgi:membrane protein implicated in regulation of membrane protease activity